MPSASVPPTIPSLTDRDAAPALAAFDLVKRFGGLAAVDGVSLALPRGQIAGLIGPNGAGKSTLFDLLAGEQRADAGRIEIGGARVERLGPEARLKHGLGRTFQIPRPFAALTALENLMLGAQGQAGERILPNFYAPRRVAAEERAARDKARACSLSSAWSGTPRPPRACCPVANASCWSWRAR